MALKYGPPGLPRINNDYRRHKAYCSRIKRFVDWDTYLTRPTSMYGYPGCSDREKNSHKCFCHRNKRYYFWDEYVKLRRGYRVQPLRDIGVALKQKVQALGLMPKPKV